MSQVEPPIVTRFAPSPTGLLHLGHAYAALKARASASSSNHFFLRFDDLDQSRYRPQYESKTLTDLEWLGLQWNPNIRKQTTHFDQYRKALSRLKELDLVYPCFCTRKEIQQETERSGNAPHGPSGSIYPGICKKRSKTEIEIRLEKGEEFALRLDIDKTYQLVGPDLVWIDLNHGEHRADPRPLGDVVLARKDSPTSYHLAVVIDDTEQGINRVTRGKDLLHATHLHRVLQELLNLPVPIWQHHALITDENGHRLAKSAKAQSLDALRSKGWTPRQVIEYLAHQTHDFSILS